MKTGNRDLGTQGLRRERHRIEEATLAVETGSRTSQPCALQMNEPREANETETHLRLSAGAVAVAKCTVY
jgi:hypothetical protein